MAKTVLQIAQAAATIVGLSKPSSLLGNDPIGQLLKALLEEGGQTLSRKRGPFGETWAGLTREHSFDTIADQDQYELPADFANLISETAWNRDTYRRSPGPLTPQEWQEIKGGLVDTVSLSPRYMIRANTEGAVKFTIDPVPSGDGGDTIAFEYASRNWLANQSGGPAVLEEISADNNVPVYPEPLLQQDLIWRAKESRGLAYGARLGLFEDLLNRVFSQSTGTALRDVILGQVHRPHSLGVPAVPETGFGVDVG